MSNRIVENWFDIEIFGKYSYSKQIDLLVESASLDIQLYDAGILQEGVLGTLKEKLISLIDKFIQWIKGIGQKIKSFFTKRSSAETVEANFKAAKKRKTAQGESYNMLSEAYSIEESNESYVTEEATDDEIKAANEKIYEILKDNDPVFNFRNNKGPFMAMEDLIEEVEKCIKSGAEIKDEEGSIGYILRLTDKYESPNDYFNKNYNKYSGSIISANTDYVENGLEYFMDDFKHIDGYIKSCESDLEKSYKALDQLEQRMKNSTNDEEIRVCMKGISAINKARPWYTAWLYQLKKTKFIITKISEIARGPHQLVQ